MAYLKILYLNLKLEEILLTIHSFRANMWSWNTLITLNWSPYFKCKCLVPTQIY